MTSVPVANIVSWLGADIHRLWLASFTVDEHEAFAIAYRALGGRVAVGDVRLAFQRAGFRRAGAGVMPRSWLVPVDVPAESPLATYHPKLLLAECDEGFALVVSTANLAMDDLHRTTNLAVQIRISASDAHRVATWITKPPLAHRALCLVVDGKETKIAPPFGNRSTFQQFLSQLRRCQHCRKQGARRGNWIVAAPFWSPGTFRHLLDAEPGGTIEGYVRVRSIWDQLGAALSDVERKKIHAYELREGDSPPRWHHKLLAWRCCDRPGGRSALYLGSANATIYGLVGRAGKAVNWEAGVIWLGRAALWKHAREVARAGFSATYLKSPRPVATDTGNEDEVGPIDSDELQRTFMVHTARALRVDRHARRVSRRSGANIRVRAFGINWSLQSLELLLESKKKGIEDRGRLTAKKSVIVPADARAQVRAVFRAGDGELAEASVDLWELDPAPPFVQPTTRSSIAAALAGLAVGGDWDEGDGNVRTTPGANVGTTDVRFPFADFLALRARSPEAAARWLQRLTGDGEAALAGLPGHWRAIAKALSDG